MKKTKFIKALSFFASVVLIAAIALTCIGCNNTDVSSNPSVSDVAAEKVSFTFKVTADGETKTFDIETDEKTVGAALLKEGLIEGEESQYGLYVKKVNGILADYDVDGTYWAFYVDGAYAASGVDTTDIEDGAVYEFRKEK